MVILSLLTPRWVNKSANYKNFHVFNRMKNHSSATANVSFFRSALIALGTIILIILAFVAKVTYFSQNKRIGHFSSANPSNKASLNSKDNLANIFLISPDDLSRLIRNEHYFFVDVRSPEEFKRYHIEASHNYPLNELVNELGSVDKLTWDKKKEVIVIDQTEREKSKALAVKLVQAGYQTKYLEGGLISYQNKGFNLVSFGDPNSPRDKAKVIFISPEKLKQRIKNEEIFSFLDVRPRDQYQKSYIKGSVNIPLEELEARKNDLPIGGNLVVIDQDPLRSFQAAVRLFDMNVLGVFCLSESLETLR
jgi:rhodanese-related sulfurtransferase